MRLQDAPPAGWYPDPETDTRLRWWDGSDWSDTRRPPPSAAETAGAMSAVAATAARPTSSEPVANVGLTAAETDRLVSQVRTAAREEVARAADVFSQRAQRALRQGRSLLSEYITRVLRWVRIAIVVIAIAVIVWFILQFLVQAAFLDWIGDRIDNVTD